jgi:hypothetical protein
VPNATTNRYMYTGSRNTSPASPLRVWNTSTLAPSVAANPRPTEAIRYHGATTLRSSRPRMSRMRIAAVGNTTA